MSWNESDRHETVRHDVRRKSATLEKTHAYESGVSHKRIHTPDPIYPFNIDRHQLKFGDASIGQDEFVGAYPRQTGEHLLRKRQSIGKARVNDRAHHS